MTIQPKFKYEAVQFHYQEKEKSINEIKNLLEASNVEILKIEEQSVDTEIYLFVKNENWELDVVTVMDGWYIWVDEINLVNSASPEYVKKHYEECK